MKGPRHRATAPQGLDTPTPFSILSLDSGMRRRPSPSPSPCPSPCPTPGEQPLSFFQDFISLSLKYQEER